MIVRAGKGGKDRLLMLPQSLVPALREQSCPKRMCHAFATHGLQAGHDIRTVQDLLGHADAATMMIYTHVLKVGGPAVRSALDSMNFELIRTATARS